jgi:hypothetical protein
MWFLIGITFFVTIVSLIIDRGKTIAGIKKGLKMFFGILPALLNILIAVSVGLYLIPDD